MGSGCAVIVFLIAAIIVVFVDSPMAILGPFLKFLLYCSLFGIILGVIIGFFERRR